MYVVGISSGFFGLTKEEEIMGINKKIQWGVTQGVRFVQVDLEAITEFKEPNLEEKIKKNKELGIEFGIHGETGAFGGGTVFKLDSALEDDYIRSHQRLILSLEAAGKIGSKYYLLHSSESLPFINLWHDLQPTKLVDIFGRPLSVFLKGEPKLLKWLFDVMENEKIPELKPFGIVAPKMYYEDLKEKYKDEKKLNENKIKEIAEEQARKRLFDIVESEQMHYGPERLAYYITAKWMEMEKDPLWTEITGGKSIDDPKFRAQFEKWVPAVTAKYIWGHFNPKKPEFKDPKKILEKYKIYFVLETPTGFAGGENLGRFSRPLHMYYLAREVRTKYFGLTIDIEHMLGNNIDPKKEFELFPSNAGSTVKVIHIGYPTPLHTAHKALYLGSEEQQYVYERLWQLRQKGFKDGYLIFERAAKEDIQNSILSVRMIKHFLEKNVPPKELPEEFYGMPKGGPEIARQKLAIKEHALEPLKGMLVAPEEEHTFLSASAKEKEKWKKEEYR